MREIARAFLVGEDTVSQRILRAKRKIAAAGIPYRVPPRGARAERLDGVLAVIYLVFTEGYAPSDGSPVRDPLAEEAIRLARLVATEVPGEPEARGLLALWLLQQSRRAARIDAHGRMVTLERQDRTLWDHALINECVVLARDAVTAAGPYALQAAIAAQHALAPVASATDWGTAVALYDRLLAQRTNPVVALNRAVALGMRDGPQAQLDAVDFLGTHSQLAGNHAVPAVRADALRRLGRAREAMEAYRAAEAMAPNGAIAREYRQWAAELEPVVDPGDCERRAGSAAPSLAHEGAVLRRSRRGVAGGLGVPAGYGGSRGRADGRRAPGRAPAPGRGSRSRAAAAATIQFLNSTA